MIVRVNGSYPFRVWDEIHWCGRDEDGEIAGGLPFSISSTFGSYTGNASGIIPIDEARRLRDFLNRWLEKYASKKGTYREKT